MTSNPLTTPSSSRAFTVTVEDGSVIEYTMRGLREDEIGGWACFCASVFSYKDNPPPASYFERHYRNDPLAEADLVRVILWNGTTLVSSCRIFQKEVSLGNGTSVVAGGIGEVCTSVDHRRRGLSKRLLHDAIEIMKGRPMELSFLHAAPDFFPVYEKGGGYKSTLSEWSVTTLNTDRLLGATSANDSMSAFTSRLAEFPKDTKHLQLLHQEFSEKKFLGCIIRSKDYWNHYLSQELAGTLQVLEDDTSKSIVAWMSLRQRGGRFQMREFGCDLTKCHVAMAVPPLLVKCLLGFGSSYTSAATIDLHLPTFVLSAIRSGCIDYVHSVVEENDLGWMYVTLKEGGVDMMEVHKTAAHHIWPADAF